MKQLAAGVVLGALAALGGVLLGARLTASAIGAGAAALGHPTSPQAFLRAMGPARGSLPGNPSLPPATPGPGGVVPPAGNDKPATLQPSGELPSTENPARRERPDLPGRPRDFADGQRRDEASLGTEGSSPSRRLTRAPGEAPSYVGTLRPAQVALVSSPNPGTISRVFVREGQRVRAGTPLFELEHFEASRRLVEAEANLKAARERAKEASTEGAPPMLAPPAPPEATRKGRVPPLTPNSPGPDRRAGAPVARFDPEAHLRIAELEVQNARRMVAMATLKAPIAGVVRAVPAPREGAGRGQETLAFLQSDPDLPRAGTNIAANVPLCAVVSTGKPVIAIAVEETDMGRVYGGQTAVITPQAFPGVRLTGRVAHIGALPQSRGGNTTFPVTVEVISPLGRVRLGMSARVTLLRAGS